MIAKEYKCEHCGFRYFGQQDDNIDVIHLCEECAEKALDWGFAAHWIEPEEEA